jgi:hypothetical protein
MRLWNGMPPESLLAAMPCRKEVPWGDHSPRQPARSPRARMLDVIITTNPLAPVQHHPFSAPPRRSARHPSSSEEGSTLPNLTAQLRGQWAEYYPTHYNKWCKLTKACIDQIIVAFKKESRGHSSREGEELTYANYFKNQSYVARMLNAKLPADIKRSARVALEP